MKSITGSFYCDWAHIKNVPSKFKQQWKEKWNLKLLEHWWTISTFQISTLQLVPSLLFSFFLKSHRSISHHSRHASLHLHFYSLLTFYFIIFIIPALWAQTFELWAQTFEAISCNQGNVNHFIDLLVVTGISHRHESNSKFPFGWLNQCF